MAYEYSRPPPADEGSAAASLISRIRKGQLPNLFVYHPVSLDVTGHKSGPRGAATKRAIARFDRTTGRILSAIEHSPAKILCITMSDHGMQPIENLFDSQSRIRRLPLRIGKDYLYFMDSTMIRFWFETASAEDIIRSDFSGPGRFLTQRDLEAAAIGKPDRFYGDLFFAIEQGWAVYPDFFRRTHRPRGMHGYYRQTYDTPVAIVGGSPGLSPRFTVPEGNHTDICRTMADFLGLKAPFEMDGKPIVEYS